MPFDGNLTFRRLWGSRPFLVLPKHALHTFVVFQFFEVRNATYHFSEQPFGDADLELTSHPRVLLDDPFEVWIILCVNEPVVESHAPLEFLLRDVQVCEPVSTAQVEIPFFQRFETA